MASNVMHLKKEKEGKQQQNQGSKAQTTYTGKADIGGPWLLYNIKG